MGKPLSSEEVTSPSKLRQRAEVKTVQKTLSFEAATDQEHVMKAQETRSGTGPGCMVVAGLTKNGKGVDGQPKLHGKGGADDQRDQTKTDDSATGAGTGVLKMPVVSKELKNFKRLGGGKPNEIVAINKVVEKKRQLEPCDLVGEDLKKKHKVDVVMEEANNQEYFVKAGLLE